MSRSKELFMQLREQEAQDQQHATMQEWEHFNFSTNNLIQISK